MIIDKNKSCCFSGHRKIPPENYDEISKRLEKVIVQLIECGYVYFCSGGALGFDTLAAQVVNKLRQKHPDIKLLLILPCRNQSKGWSAKNKRLYEKIKGDADDIVYSSDAYYRGCMHKRNRYLVDHSCICVCYFTKDTGGTAYTVNYAIKKKRIVRNVAEES